MKLVEVFFFDGATVATGSLITKVGRNSLIGIAKGVTASVPSKFVFDNWEDAHKCLQAQLSETIEALGKEIDELDKIIRLKRDTLNNLSGQIHRSKHTLEIMTTDD